MGSEHSKEQLGPDPEDYSKDRTYINKDELRKRVWDRKEEARLANEQAKKAKRKLMRAR